MNPRYLFDDPTLKPALSNFAGYKGALRSLCLSDDPWATRPAVELLCSGFTASQAGNPDRHPGRRRRDQNRPSWLLPPRASRHALARCCGMDGGGGIAIPPSCPGERRDDGERGASCRLTGSRHTPRKRGIQYAAASRVNVNISGILDHPLSRMITAWEVLKVSNVRQPNTPSHSRGASRPSYACNLHP